MADFWLQKNLWSGKTTGQVLKNRLSEHFDPGRARAIFFNFKFFFPSNFFNFKIFGDKIFGEKKKVPNFNTGRIIRNLHFPKLQWLTYIKTYKDTWCFQVCNARVGIDGRHWSIILFYSWWQLIIMVTFYWNNYEKISLVDFYRFLATSKIIFTAVCKTSSCLFCFQFCLFSGTSINWETHVNWANQILSFLAWYSW